MGAADWVIKTLQQGDSGASGLKALMCWEAGLPREGKETLHPSSPILCPMYLFHLAVPELHPLQ